ncbi:MAG: DUF3179 domain-containing protein [Planctomycetes bacterium]|nr:DUF3179 domain-containing protein [Planctomycetota bacterium]
MLERYKNSSAKFLYAASFLICIFSCVANSRDDKEQKRFPGLKTNTDKTLIDLSELGSGGVGKDGIPSINSPDFISIKNAKGWLKPNEPVIAVSIGTAAKAYPLQILIWHEMVNDTIKDVPVLVTFCPLCYSAVVFDRRINRKTHSFGVSGLLRHSDMVMYDRTTESLWQQFTGEAVVGDFVGETLKRLPGQIISFAQFAKAYPFGQVLSRKTGHKRRYGQNPYKGYDDINKTPFLYKGTTDPRLSPMEKVVGVKIGKSGKAYPYSVTRKKRVINDTIAGKAVVVLHTPGAASALDAAIISKSKQAGSTGVFGRKVDGRLLNFVFTGRKFQDRETESVWDITGTAVKGPLKGKHLEKIVYGDYFAFAWLAFRTDTEIYKYTGGGQEKNSKAKSQK